MKDICIVTGCASGLGYGHVSRMITLLSLLDAGGYKTAFYSRELPPFFPRHLRKYCVQQPEHCSVLIRDLRDSPLQEIESLRKFTKRIVVIDDDGPGRELSDAIDLLPRPGRKTVPGLFLYGYNYVSFIIKQNASKTPITKEFDLYLYGVAEELSDFFSLTDIPFLLPKEGRVIYHDKTKRHYLSISTAEAMIKSRVVLTHYGLSLFEAIASNNFVGLVNPTEYHSQLCDNLIQTHNHRNIKNYGKIDILNKDALFSDLFSFLSQKINETTPSDISKTIADSHNNMMKVVAQYLS